MINKLEISHLKNGDCILVHNYPFKEGFNTLGWCTHVIGRKIDQFIA